jgi:hypothetical protein
VAEKRILRSPWRVSLLRDRGSLNLEVGADNFWSVLGEGETALGGAVAFHIGID